MTSIFVGNLPYNCCEADLRNTFERFGRVNSVQIMTEQSTSRSRGFGFVRMPSLDDADEAIKHLAGSNMGGRQLTVNEAQTDRRTPTGVSTAARDKVMEWFGNVRGE